jgi:hypothetical protein
MPVLGQSISLLLPEYDIGLEEGREQGARQPASRLASGQAQ